MLGSGDALYWHYQQSLYFNSDNLFDYEVNYGRLNLVCLWGDSPFRELGASLEKIRGGVLVPTADRPARSNGHGHWVSEFGILCDTQQDPGAVA
ncbi:hypothetical protein GQX73_g9959 [Xylaria multiplex]|uniref:Uncharacterized protein n=1 Tax=Xylaria multiplex TaxID=323545 RepID=A0A7C8ILT7_9PEZI|nr:hypothetical protein GQX73_g9959 [Xylaria multiplex]